MRNDDDDDFILLMVQLLWGNCSVLICIQGMAIAARSQGKHKQRIWVNISLTGIKIVDEKTGVSSFVYTSVSWFVKLRTGHFICHKIVYWLYSVLCLISFYLSLRWLSMNMWWIRSHSLLTMSLITGRLDMFAEQRGSTSFLLLKQLSRSEFVRQTQHLMIDNKSGHSMVDVQVQLNKCLLIYGVGLTVLLNKRRPCKIVIYYIYILFGATSKNYTKYY